jgi:diadenosine tetraphosphate (Ap4A) HIT family hydrolase
MTASTWPDDWDERKRGAECPMCANQGLEDNGFGRRVLQGEFADVFLQRTTPLPGYCIAVWKGEHVAEPTQLEPAQAAGFWAETLAAAHAVEAEYRPAKLNFMTLGNGVPHLHTHVLPRTLDDPAAGAPLPWALITGADPTPDDAFAAQVAALRRRIGSRGR